MIPKAIRILAVACLIYFTSFAKAAFATDVPTPVGHIYIQDFANVFSGLQKEELTNYGIGLDDATSAQFACVNFTKYW